MSKFISLLVISVIGFNTHADELKEESICIKDSLVQILKSDQSKKERQIVFNVTSDDLELKKLLQRLIPGSENKTFYVVDLDTLWDWDIILSNPRHALTRNNGYPCQSFRFIWTKCKSGSTECRPRGENPYLCCCLIWPTIPFCGNFLHFNCQIHQQDIETGGGRLDAGV